VCRAGRHQNALIVPQQVVRAKLKVHERVRMPAKMARSRPRFVIATKTRLSRVYQSATSCAGFGGVWLSDVEKHLSFARCGRPPIKRFGIGVRRCEDCGQHSQFQSRYDLIWLLAKRFSPRQLRRRRKAGTKVPECCPLFTGRNTPSATSDAFQVCRNHRSSFRSCPNRKFGSILPSSCRQPMSGRRGDCRSA
jgi:hypothetical protein